MVSHQLVTTVIALFVIAIIALVAVTAFTILRYKQTKAQGHLHILVPLLSQLIGCILIFTPVGPQAYACTTVIASYSTAAIIAFHSAQWAKSMRNHIGTKTVKFFQGAFYFWMAVYIIVAIIVCIFFSSAYDTSILGGFTTNNGGSAFAAVFVIAYFLAIIGAVFGFFSSISYIMLLPKSAEQYGNQKKRVSYRLISLSSNIILTSQLVASNPLNGHVHCSDCSRYFPGWSNYFYTSAYNHIYFDISTKKCYAKLYCNSRRMCTNYTNIVASSWPAYDACSHSGPSWTCTRKRSSCQYSSCSCSSCQYSSRLCSSRPWSSLLISSTFK
ncbi:hypothetical protein BDF22DRAFT_671900 [Syncephalis plumigaleata]|nr:hypothetical protein BDF22DRAFT_671900 [Syncephalis plumigaleata]